MASQLVCKPVAVEYEMYMSVIWTLETSTAVVVGGFQLDNLTVIDTNHHPKQCISVSYMSRGDLYEFSQILIYYVTKGHHFQFLHIFSKN